MLDVCSKLTVVAGGCEVDAAEAVWEPRRWHQHWLPGSSCPKSLLLVDREGALGATVWTDQVIN